MKKQIPILSEVEINECPICGKEPNVYASVEEKLLRYGYKCDQSFIVTTTCSCCGIKAPLEKWNILSIKEK